MDAALMDTPPERGAEPPSPLLPPLPPPSGTRTAAAMGSGATLSSTFCGGEAGEAGRQQDERVRAGERARQQAGRKARRGEAGQGRAERVGGR